jgi:tetrapyrrole methylase family protein/MazG family protein
MRHRSDKPAVTSAKKRTNKSRISRRPNPPKQLAKTSAKRALKPKTPRGPSIPITARDKRAGKWFEKLVALQARLRGPGGCPWDREQTHNSLRKFLIEETYEVLDAMESSDAEHFASELGDLLLQVVFHSILAEENGAFTISDVIESVHSKMVRRHPHVFSNARAKNSKEVLKNWEQIKSEERKAERARTRDLKSPGQTVSRDEEAADSDVSEQDAASILSDVPKSLPAALEAYQLTRRAARIGFDWDDLAGIFEKIDEEKAEIVQCLDQLAANAPQNERPSGVGTTSTPPDLANLEEEVGDLLFAAVNVARFVGTDPEIALKHANRKFLRRFQWMESAARAEGKKFADLPRERMEALWNLSKQQKASKSAAAQ